MADIDLAHSAWRPVLWHEVPGGDAQLAVRGLGAGRSTCWASRCPALRISDPPTREDVASTRVSLMVTPASVLVLCLDAQPGLGPAHDR